MILVVGGGDIKRGERATQICGWVALVLSTLVSAFWAMWGAAEGFHEGWWAATLIGRLGQTTLYMAPMGITLIMGALAVRWPRFGGIVFFVLGAAFSWMIFSGRSGNLTWEVILSWLPLTVMVVGVGFLWWFGKPRPLKLAYAVFLGVPLITALAVGAFPAWKVAHRIDDGIRTARLVEGNGVDLIWAPAGPGWVRDAERACDWDSAMNIAAHLSNDGTKLLDEPMHYWRLPTVDEAVRSMALHGNNCGGVWDADAKHATYTVHPDKESPLWDTYAETIYWWTGTEDGEDRAFMIVYDGIVWSKPKGRSMGSQGFRAVKEP